MNHSIFRFTLNMHSHQSQISIPIFRGDTAVKLYISISDGVKIYDIADGCLAVLTGKKADGHFFTHSCPIEENTRVVYEFCEQTSNCEGIVNCTLSLYGPDGKVVTAPKFTLLVDENVIYDDDIELSEDDTSALQTAFTNEASRIDAENRRVAAETDRAEAETARSTAETTRVDNETQRGIDEGLRRDAEDDRRTAEIARKEAEDARRDAEEGRVDFIKATAKAELAEAKEYADATKLDKADGAVIDKRITNLERQIAPEFFQTDSSVKYIKAVPANTCPYAQIDSIGGMTIKKSVKSDVEGAVAINVVPLSGGSDNGDRSKLSCTYENGTLTIVATGITSPDEPAFLYYYIADASLEGWYKAEFETDMPSGWLSEGFDLGGSGIWISNGEEKYIEALEEGSPMVHELKVAGDIRADGTYYVKPRLYKYEVMQDNKVTAVKLVGKNLAQKQYGIMSYGSAVNNTVIRIDTKGDCAASLIKVDGGKKYAISKTQPADINSAFRYFWFDREPVLDETVSIHGEYVPAYSTIVRTAPKNAKYLFVCWSINETKYPCGDVQIELADAATAYEPYSERVVELPEGIKASMDGVGIDNTYYNYIDFESGKAVVKCKKYTFNGSESWTYGGTNAKGLHRYNSSLPTGARKGTINGLCDKYPTWNGAWNSNGEESVRFGQANTAFYLYLANELTVAEVKELVMGMEIVYVIDTPIETDITTRFDNLISVEPNGTIEFVNEHTADIPNSVTYMLKEVD